MAPANLTPVHSKFTSIFATSRRSLRDVGDALSKVELGIFLRVTALDFDEGCVIVLVAKATLVSEDGSGEIEANWLSVLLGHDSLLCFG